MSEKTRPCEICGEMIDPERAEALPDTRLCTEHARQVAKFGGEFKLTLKQASLGKQGSLKKNAGDVSVAGKRRNTLGVAKLKERLKEEAKREEE
jgi:hypothetical protein